MSESTGVKMSHCWKSHVEAHLAFFRFRKDKLVTHLTGLSSLSVSLELFCVSRKLFLSLTASDVTVYQTSKGKEVSKQINHS